MGNLVATRWVEYRKETRVVWFLCIIIADCMPLFCEQIVCPSIYVSKFMFCRSQMKLWIIVDSRWAWMAEYHFLLFELCFCSASTFWPHSDGPRRWRMPVQIILACCSAALEHSRFLIMQCLRACGISSFSLHCSFAQNWILFSFSPHCSFYSELNPFALKTQETACSPLPSGSPFGPHYDG